MKPDLVESCVHRGRLLLEAGRSAEAIAMLNRAAEIQPTSALAWSSLGRAYCMLGRLAEAESCCRRATELDSGAYEAQLVLGIALLRRHQYLSARESLQRALQMNPGSAEAHYWQGNLHRMLGDSGQARSSFRRALECDPEHVSSRLELAACCCEEHQETEAELELRELVRRGHAPDGVYLQYGNCLRDCALFPNAEAAYRRAISLAPQRADLHCALGTVLHSQCKLQEALEAYGQAMHLRPDFPEARWSRALSLLLGGDFEAGWREYEWRWRCSGNRPPSLPQPRWDGSDLAGKSILVYEEQGVGDQIMFASCIPDLISRAGQVVVQFDRRFRRLFERTFPTAIVNPAERKGKETMISVDVHCALGDLPRFLRPTPAHFPERAGYLSPDPAAVEKWRDRYAAIGDRLNVGISWRGGAVRQTLFQRSIPLTQWGPVLALNHAQFCSLQYGECSEEIAQIRTHLGVTIHAWQDSDPLRDLDDFCAQIAALDLVISVDNSTVHMAGAIGKPTLALLSFGPDWRWLLDRRDSPWYPSVKLYRQEIPGEWETVLSAVAGDLRKRL